MFGRQKIAMLVAEFLGTAVLATALINLITRGSASGLDGALTVGLTLGILTLVIGPISGAHVNPAITIGLWSLRKVQTMQAVVYVAAQALGGLAAWRLAEYFSQKPMEQISRDFDFRILLAEAVGTFIFAFGVAAAVNRAYEGGKLAAVVGGSLAVGVLVTVASAGVLNPALAVATQTWSWEYVLGPVIGSILGMNLYVMLFASSGKKKK